MHFRAPTALVLAASFLWGSVAAASSFPTQDETEVPATTSPVEAPRPAPHPLLVVAVPTVVTLAGMGTGLAIEDDVGLAVFFGSYLLFPSIGNLWLQNWGSAALWFGLRAASGVALVAGLALLLVGVFSGIGGNNSGSGPAIIGGFILMIGGGVGGTVGLVGDIVHAGIDASRRRASTPTAAAPFAVTPFIDRTGVLGVAASWSWQF